MPRQTKRRAGAAISQEFTRAVERIDKREARAQRGRLFSFGFLLRDDRHTWKEL
jgi:hypothetical protein